MVWTTVCGLLASAAVAAAAETGEYLVMAPAHAGKPAQVLVYAVVPAH
jgi:hypothetical protein